MNALEEIQRIGPAAEAHRPLGQLQRPLGRQAPLELELDEPHGRVGVVGVLLEERLLLEAT